jgi:glycerol 2-dehydrogenase (NADP+)
MFFFVGSTIPAVGLGTWQGTIEVARFEDVNNNLSGGFGTSDAQALKASIIHALQNGYRLIDTAQYYGVESVVGEAVRESGIKREEITIVTKFWGQFHHDPAKALQKSLNQLNLEYVDIFLMHWPWALTEDGKPLRIAETPTFCETWKMMQELVGPQCHGIGVSNFTQKTLDTLLETASIIPLVNQVELHAFNPCFNLVLFCQSKKIHVISWRQVIQLLSRDSLTNIHSSNCVKAQWEGTEISVKTRFSPTTYSHLLPRNTNVLQV